MGSVGEDLISILGCQSSPAVSGSPPPRRKNGKGGGRDACKGPDGGCRKSPKGEIFTKAGAALRRAEGAAAGKSGGGGAEFKFRPDLCPETERMMMMRQRGSSEEEPRRL